MTSNTTRHSSGEELANALTHAVGAALSVAALVILVTYSGLAGDAWRVVSFSIYGASLIALYLSSTFYHALSASRHRRLLRILDHSAIFLLIAGTYTPVTLVTLRGGWGWTLFGLVWGLAVAGLVLTLFFVDRFRLLTVAVYLGMGWLGVIAVKPMFAAMPTGGLIWLGLGGLSYSGGVVFYLWRKLPFNHAIWHLFVLGGSVCHFFCFLFYVLHAEG